LSKILAIGVGDGFQGRGLLAGHIGSVVQPFVVQHHQRALMRRHHWTPKVKPYLSNTFCLCYEEITMC
jgi:hypothetical protein